VRLTPAGELVVERAGDVGLDRGDLGGDGIVDVHERPAAGASAEHWRVCSWAAGR
jgi:hypothetical protein